MKRSESIDRSAINAVRPSRRPRHNEIHVFNAMRPVELGTPGVDDAKRGARRGASFHRVSDGVRTRIFRVVKTVLYPLTLRRRQITHTRVRQRTDIDRDEGASLILALVVVIVISYATLYVGKLVTTDIAGAQAFSNQRLEANTLNGAANVALQTLRYSANDTPNAQPSICWGSDVTSGLSTQLGNGSKFNPIVSYTADAWCELVSFTPADAATRVVAVDVCPSTVTAAACVAHPTLAVNATFDDYSPGEASLATICTPSCGQAEAINSWVGL